MQDTFVIFYEGKVLIVLKINDMPPLPNSQQILDWYAKNYAFERFKLTGCYSHSIDVSQLKYEDF